MTPTFPLRPCMSAALVALALQGCGTRLLEPDPLNKTTSIVNGTQVTRGPSRGVLASGFAETVAPVGNSFEPAIGEPFAVEDLSALPGNDLLLPELQGIDFGAEQAGVATYIETGGLSSGDATSSAAYFADQIGQAVYFATDSADLNELARETLRKQAAWLNVNTGARATIEGHADERGTREYNLALGDRRASATRGYLIAVGVDESRLDKTSYGKERPVALGSSEQAWARNRRTETVITGGFDGGDAVFSGILPGEVAPVEDSFASGIATATLDYDPLFPDTGATTQVYSPGASGDLVLDPLYPSTGGPVPSSGLYDAQSGQSLSYDGTATSIAPTVFDSTTYATSPLAATTATPSRTRIEDVSVDDLLRDPGLIDRIGTPVTTTMPGS